MRFGLLAGADAGLGLWAASRPPVAAERMAPMPPLRMHQTRFQGAVHYEMLLGEFDQRLHRQLKAQRAANLNSFGQHDASFSVTQIHDVSGQDFMRLMRNECGSKVRSADMESWLRGRLKVFPGRSFSNIRAPDLADEMRVPEAGLELTMQRSAMNQMPRPDPPGTRQAWPGSRWPSSRLAARHHHPAAPVS